MRATAGFIRSYRSAPRRLDDDAGVRLDPDQMILDLLDAGDVLRRDADRLALALVGQCALQLDDAVLDGDVDQPDRRPGMLPQLGEQALANLGVAGGDRL